MTGDNVKLLRDTVFKDIPVELFVDNARIYQSDADGTTLAWDDTNQIMYAFRECNISYYQPTAPMIVDATEYVNIQYMNAALTPAQLRVVLNTLLSKGTINQTQYDKIIANAKLTAGPGISISKL